MTNQTQLTLAEQERLAFIQGDTRTASLLAEIADLEREIDGGDDLREALDAVLSVVNEYAHRDSACAVRIRSILKNHGIKG